MACGQSVLEVAANPYVTTLGPVESSEQRLNLAQSFNATGAVSGGVVGLEDLLSGIEYTPAQQAAMAPAQLFSYRISERRGEDTLPGHHRNFSPYCRSHLLHKVTRNSGINRCRPRKRECQAEERLHSRRLIKGWWRSFTT